MKQESINTFNGGLSYDLNPITNPSDELTDCVNGTFITFNGDELVLQNDAGNTTIGIEETLTSTEIKYGALYNLPSLITFETNMQALELTFDNVLNVPVIDAENVANWNAFFDLPANGNEFTSVEVNSETINPATVIERGFLYNMFIATDDRNITSSDDWQIPLIADIMTLGSYLGGNSIAGGKLKETGFVYWSSPNAGATNEVNFNSRGTGLRSSVTGMFEFLSALGYYMLRDVDLAPNYSRIWTMIYDQAAINFSTPSWEIGVGIRLVRAATIEEQAQDDGTPCAPYIQNNGLIIPTVKIGTQVWITSNLSDTQFRNKEYIHGFENGVYNPISNADWISLTSSAVCAYGDVIPNAIMSNCFVKLYGGSWITLKDSLFSANSHLINIVDKSNCIIFVNNWAFASATGLKEINLPVLRTVGQGGFRASSGIKIIYIPLCTNLGGNVLNTEVLDAIIGQSITLTISAILMTCNSGAPDGDIQTLQANNTVTIITV